MKQPGLSIGELDAIGFYDKPFLKFERLLETKKLTVSKKFKLLGIWLNEKLFLKKQIYKGLAQIEKYSKKDVKLLFSEHHLSHAASAFYPSPFDSAAVLTLDGVGEWTTDFIRIGRKGKDLKVLKEIHFPHSLGLLYSHLRITQVSKLTLVKYK